MNHDRKNQRPDFRQKLIKRLKRSVDDLVHGPRYEACEDIPDAKLMTERMINAHAWCAPLNEPVAWRGPDDQMHMQADDPILGIYRGGHAWALPWWIMKNHHVANLTLQHEPILVTLCEVCSSASAFLAVLDSQRYDFRLAGLYNGSNLITDSATGSFWSPFQGEAISGPCKGKKLQRIALVQCAWEEWRCMHPTTLVPWAEQKMREGHGAGHLPGTPGMGASMRKTLLNPIDQRLEHNILVLGVHGNGNGEAFPLAELDQAGPIVYTQVDDEEIVILHPKGSLLALAFSPLINDTRVQLQIDAQGMIRDQETNSQWSFEGECYAGSRSGEQLAYINSGIEEWYSWAANHPSTCIFHAS